MNEENIVEGRNSVMELLEGERDINKIFIQSRRKTWLYNENNC